MRARQYMSDVVGGEGAVLAHHAKPDDFKKKFEEAHVMDEAPVQKFLEKIQSDKEGYRLLSNLFIIISFFILNPFTVNPTYIWYMRKIFRPFSLFS